MFNKRPHWMLEDEYPLADWLTEKGQASQLSFEQSLDLIRDLHGRISPEFTRNLIATLRSPPASRDELLWYSVNLMVLAVRLGKAEAPKQFLGG